MIKETAKEILLDKIEKHVLAEIGDLDNYIERIVKEEVREAIRYFLGIEISFGNYRFKSDSFLKHALSEQIKDKALRLVKEGNLVEEITIPATIKKTAVRQAQTEFNKYLREMLSKEIFSIARDKYELIDVGILETLKKRENLEEVLIQEI